MTASQEKNSARRNMITLRTSDDEKNAIKARARAYGLSIGAFIREIALDKPLPKATRFTKEQGQLIAMILSSLGAMMDHIRKLDQDRQGQDAANSLKRDLLFLRERCFEALGREP